MRPEKRIDNHMITSVPIVKSWQYCAKQFLKERLRGLGMRNQEQGMP